MYQHQQLLDRAQKLGLGIKDVSRLMHKHAAILEKDDVSELVIDGIPTSWINVRSQFYCDNKQLTKFAYEGLNIPYPKGIAFANPRDQELQSFVKEGQTYVCKPLDGTNGVGVQMNIRSLGEVHTYYENFGHLDANFLIEEQIEGVDMRIHVMQGKIVAACIREPAFVLGNGKASLETLIEERRAEMRSQNPNNVLVLDAVSNELLRTQQVVLSDIPANNQKIILKNVANIAQGGIPIDITDDLHPIYQKWVTALSNYLKTGYFGLDVIAKDYTKHPIGQAYVIEINARADWLHHTFSKHKTHDIAGIILSELFTE